MAQLSLSVLRCPDHGSAEQRLVRGVELTIGRGTECDWVLPDPLRSLSRKHCRLEQVGAGWQVVDLSANGTYVNFDNEAIGRDQAQPLRDGDRLRLGDYELEVRLAPAGAALGDSPFDPGPTLGPGLGTAAGAGLAAGAAPGGGFGAGSPSAPAPGLFGEAAGPAGLGGAGGTPLFGGFGSARLPGLDDPVPPDDAGAGLDLDISGGRSAFTPAPAFGAQDDHAPSTGDAYRPPAVMPPGAAGPAVAPAPGGQAIVPDDWLQSLALGAPAPAAPLLGQAPPLSPVSPASPASPASSIAAPVASPAHAPPGPREAEPEPWPAQPPADDVRGPGSPFDAPAPVAGPGAGPSVQTPGWHEPVDVPLSGPGPAKERHRAPVPPPAASALAPGGAPVETGQTAQSSMSSLSALSALLAGGGLSADAVPRASQDPEAALRHAGALMQVAVAGLRALLVARGLVKREFRIEQTMLRPKENNPLKFAASDEHALASLLDPRMGGLKAVQDAVDDLSSHEVAVLAATQAAAHALLEKLSPEALEAEDPGGSGLFGASAEKRLWLAYKRRHATLMAQLEDDFDSAFGIAFARAYERAVGQRKG